MCFFERCCLSVTHHEVIERSRKGTENKSSFDDEQNLKYHQQAAEPAQGAELEISQETYKEKHFVCVTAKTDPQRNISVSD